MNPKGVARLRVAAVAMLAAGALALVACAGVPRAAETAPNAPLVTQPDIVVAAANAYRDADSALTAMMRSALLNTGTQIVAMDDGTAYVKTGDIPAEWLRDSTVQVEATYLQFARDAQVRRLFRAVILRQARMLIADPYANAFKPDYSVWERKFELDSLCYPVLLAWKYFKVSDDAGIFTSDLHAALLRVLDTMEIEQAHNARSTYRFHSDSEDPSVHAVADGTGMIWTGFRPSDDVSTYNYLVPAEMMAVQALAGLRELAARFGDAAMAARARALRLAIHAGIQKYAIVPGPDGIPVYAYEVDGLGHAVLMDDANIPNLLAAPYFGYVGSDDAVYRNTRRFVLSRGNPYFYSGRVAAGLGSPHTPSSLRPPSGMVWPLGILAQGFTTNDAAERRRVLAMLLASDPGDHRLHESFDPDDPKRLTREDFGWPNAFFVEYLGRMHGAREHPKPDTADLRFVRP
ncbi:MAG: glycoside hydrolase family 125 protein [Rudaea sp.]